MGMILTSSVSKSDYDTYSINIFRYKRAVSKVLKYFERSEILIQPFFWNHVLSFDIVEDMVPAFNPNMKRLRTRTLMQGHEGATIGISLYNKLICYSAHV